MACNTPEQGSKNRQDSYLECFIELHHKDGIDIISELGKFENHLIDNDLIKDSSIGSYLKFFDKLTQKNQLSIHQNYKISKLTKEHLFGTLDCLPELPDAVGTDLDDVHNDTINITDSNQNFTETGKLNFPLLGSKNILLLTNDRLTYRFKRIHALYQLYFLTTFEFIDYRTLPAAKGSIEIVIDELEQIIINGDSVSLNGLENKIREITNGQSGAYNYTLKCNKNTTLGIIVDVEKTLQKMPIRQYNFHTY